MRQKTGDFKSKKNITLLIKHPTPVDKRQRVSSTLYYVI